MKKLLEIASTVEPVQDGRIHIEKINWPMLSEHKATPAIHGRAIERGLLWRHDSGTYVKFTRARRAVRLGLR